MADEPEIHFFEGILPALLVGDVERVAAPLVEGGKSICRLNKSILQMLQVNIRLSALDQDLRWRVRLVALWHVPGSFGLVLVSLILLERPRL